jgi:acyl-CoA thioesterase
MLEKITWQEAPCELRAPMEPGFAAMKGAFGGWTAAHALLAAQRLLRHASPEELLTPLSLNTEFTKGIGEGVVAARPSLTSATRSTQFISVQTWHEDSLCALTSIVLARRRSTDRVESITMPTAAAPETLPVLPPLPIAVTWIERFDMRPVSGQLTRQAPAMRSLMWSRLKGEAPLGYDTLAALADANFPRIFYHYATPSPIATISMSVHFHASTQDLATVGTDFVLLEASNQIARDGFFDQQVRIWSRAGVLLATSTQLVWFDVKS